MFISFPTFSKYTSQFHVHLIFSTTLLNEQRRWYFVIRNMSDVLIENTNRYIDSTRFAPNCGNTVCHCPWSFSVNIYLYSWSSWLIKDWRMSDRLIIADLSRSVDISSHENIHSSIILHFFRCMLTAKWSENLRIILKHLHKEIT